MATTVTFLLGLAGSGKTCRAKEIEANTGAKRIDGVFGPDNASCLAELLACIRSDRPCVVEEIAYCAALSRATIVARVRSANPNAQIVWECFENDFDSANWNVRNRCDPEKPDVEGHIRWNACCTDLWGQTRMALTLGELEDLPFALSLSKGECRSGRERTIALLR